MAPATLEPVGEFQLYLDAVNKGGERVRSILYVTLVITFFIACSFFDEIYPAWDSLRLHRMQENYHCIAGLGSAADCPPGLLQEYERQGVVAPALPPGATPEEQKALTTFRRQTYEARITELVKNRLSSYKVHIPLFGDIVDINALWMLSGVLPAFLLWILATHMDRFADNFRTAKEACPNKTCGDLLRMVRVFGVSARRPPGAKHGRRRPAALAFQGLFLLPGLFNLFAILDDVADILRHDLWTIATAGEWITFALEILSVGPVLIYGLRCARTSAIIDRLEA